MVWGILVFRVWVLHALATAMTAPVDPLHRGGLAEVP